MKFQLKNIAIAVVATLAFTSCSNDDTIADNVSGNGNLKLEFDNIYGDADFAFNTEYTNSNGEKIKVNNAIYIVSNIVLTKEDGSTYNH
jgi:hypothetical protein